MNEEYKGKLAALGAASLWGINAIAVRYLFNIGINVTTILFFNAVFGAIFILLFRHKINFKPGLKRLRLISIVGILGLLNGSLMLYAIKYTKIAIAEFLHFTMPAWAFIIAVFFLKEKVGKWRILALITSLTGVALVFDINLLRNGFEITNIGNILALISAFIYATQTSIARKLEVNGYTTTFWISAISIPIIFPFYIFNNSRGSVSDIILIGMIAVFVVISALILYYYSMTKVQVTKVSIILLFELVLASILAWIIFKESLNTLNIIGGLLILASSAILIIKKK